MSILESAGFSRSNPYYIVPQGRVSYFLLHLFPSRLTVALMTLMWIDHSFDKSKRSRSFSFVKRSSWY